MPETVVQIRGLHNRFDTQIVHEDLDLDVYRGEVLGIVGGSGTGKTILLNTILGLRRPQEGTIKIFGIDCTSYNCNREVNSLWGVLFQRGALFSSMNVGENIKVPMREIAHTPPELADEIVNMKLAMVGLKARDAYKLPEELSGGMVKRVALARAMAIDAELLFLDEPTSGLDPISAAAFDQLIRTLQQHLGLTVVMITHDLDSLVTICDRIAVLVDRKIIVGTLDEVLKNKHPWIQAYFHGKRGRAIEGMA